jgi:hypothetical protein
MTVTANTDEPASKVERISTSSQPITVSDEPANRAGMMHEVRPFDAVIILEYRAKFHVQIYPRRSENVTRMEMVLPPLSDGKFHNVHRDQARRRSFRHRLPPSPFVE